ncbi:phage replisome organizer N-terminal domain-containing protein [Candidatus Chlorohelix sp.]|uniref:phage replisome organizer N-terminal domain-containing protein n=1 Tax=Candidatus Chlorohelix sp. TaxID=3139201 RepID=UPI00305D0DB2
MQNEDTAPIGVYQDTPFGMFSSEVVKNRLNKLPEASSSVIAVYIALLCFVNNTTGSCSPTHQMLAAIACSSVSQVERCLKILADAGIIEIQSNASDSTSNAYYITEGGNRYAK